MDLWRYSDRNWEPMWSDLEFYDEYGQILDAPAGYSTSTRFFGAEGEFEVEVYSERQDGPPYTTVPAPYLVMFYNVGDNLERVFVEDFPSLRMLLSDIAPILALPNRAVGSGPEETAVGEVDEGEGDSSRPPAMPANPEGEGTNGQKINETPEVSFLIDGYNPRTRWFGRNGECEVAVYSVDRKSTVDVSSPYVVEVYEIGDTLESVDVEDFPALLQLLLELAPIVALPDRGWVPEADIVQAGPAGQ